MKKDGFPKSILYVFFLIVALIALQFIYRVWSKQSNTSPTEQAIDYKLSKEGENYHHLHFQLVDPEEAPKEIKELVLKGYDIMLHTGKNAPSFVNDHLSCTNCHFAGGITTGGKNGGISLAGVAVVYPSFNQKEGKVINLTERINLCFTRSMNGKAVPLDSEIMLALETYLHWISKNYPIYKKVPWLGLQEIKLIKTPNIQMGKEIYISQCALCHGDEGQGGDNSTKNLMEYIPPLWGSESFNKKAGMAQLETLASFIYNNMPYLDASLSEDEAIDVAAFILSQPRE